MHVSDADAVAQTIELKERFVIALISLEGAHGVGVGCRVEAEELVIAVFVDKNPVA